VTAVEFAAGERATNVAQWIPLLLCLAVTAVGGWIRFSHLDTKWYFNDEMKAALHVSGQTLPDVSRYRASRVMTAGELIDRFQAPVPGVGWQKTVHALATEDSQHPPLYYVLERLSEEAFGDFVWARRVLAAAAGLALVPAVYWLCIELGAAAWTSLLAAGLVAVSPYQLVYSQEVREWTLFELLSTVSAALLLRAIRRGRVSGWLWYAGALLLTFYSAILSLLLLAAFALFIFTSHAERDRFSRRAFAVASGSALVLYLPWIDELASHWKRANAENVWMATALPIKLYLAKALFGVSAVFFDSEYTIIRTAIVLIPVAIAAAAALWWFLRWEPARTKAYVVILFAVSPLLFFISDALLRASRGTAERYFLVSAVALEIAVALGCGAALRNGRRTPALVSAAVLIIAGALSCAIDVRSPLSWENDDADSLAAAAASIGHDRGVIVTNPYVGLEIANLVAPKTPIALGPPFPAFGRSALDALDLSPAELARIRAERNEPGSAIPFAPAEPGILKKMHAGVSAAHGWSARGDTLWHFAGSP
jgi:uncharacterized membrane protein